MHRTFAHALPVLAVRNMCPRKRTCCACLIAQPAFVKLRRWCTRKSDARACSSNSKFIDEEVATGRVQAVETIQEPQWLIAGLGNIGSRYEGTRHNVGFMVIDAIALQEGIPMNKHKHKATVGFGTIENIPVLLIKPATFMNLSGESVKDAMQHYKIPKERVLVIYDDLDLATATVRLRGKGGHGGHNGMRSIAAHLGESGFPRIRVGIGRPSGSQTIINHVLAPFSLEETDLIHTAIKESADKMRAVLGLGLEKALSGVALKASKAS